MTRLPADVIRVVWSANMSLAKVELNVGPDEWKRRVEVADTEAKVLSEVMERVRAGKTRASVLREKYPGARVESLHRRLRRFEHGGRDGLIDRTVHAGPPLKLTPEVRGALRLLALQHPDLGTVALSQKLRETMQVDVKNTIVQVALKEMGLARARGRPKGKRTGDVQPAPAEHVEPLDLAGCALLEAVDQDLGAVKALTEAMGTLLEKLPAPQGPVEDDTAGRDERGRFMAEYNKPEPRREPEVGAKFESVGDQRASKDLPAMRVAQESAETRQKKNLALVLLPVVVRSVRWSALEHWRGELLGELVGFAYQASTLDKYLRGLKYAGVAEVSRESVASFWMKEDGEVKDAMTGAVLLYADVTTKPYWTHTWTKSTKVSRTGRVMPAVSTMTLHSGAGTPLLYRSWSGQVSLPKEIEAFLDKYERHAGEGTARRVVVMDRESHAVWLFKAFGEKRRFIVPLRSNVVGEAAEFEDMGEWGPYGEGPDEVRGGWLWLNDSKSRGERLRVRVVGRRRHRSEKVSWYATNVPAEEIGDADVVRLYFDRWPAQEHLYRLGNGAAGLEVLHGYGKKKVANVAVVDRLETLAGQERRWGEERTALEAQVVELERMVAELESACMDLDEGVKECRDELGEVLRGGDLEKLASAIFDKLTTMERWREEARGEVLRLRGLLTKAQVNATTKAEKLRRVAEEKATLEQRRKIFTVDVELDELMTAYKLTFMNLCRVLMNKYLGMAMELETLIEAVLTLPGERVVTPTQETVRIYRSPRDERTMKAVEQACERLTARGLVRGERRLRFEVVEKPPIRGSR